MNSEFLIALVKADHEDRTFRSLGFCRELLGALLIVVEDTNTDPPVTSRTGKAKHLGRVIAAGEMIGELRCDFLVRESADLDGPLAGRSGTGAGFHQFHFDLSSARLPNIELMGSGEGKVDNAAGDERTSIGDANQRGVSGLGIGDTHYGSQRESAMGRRHGVHIVDFTV